jgi:hypothetical protein
MRRGEQFLRTPTLPASLTFSLSNDAASRPFRQGDTQDLDEALSWVLTRIYLLFRRTSGRNQLLDLRFGKCDLCNRSAKLNFQLAGLNTMD